MSLAKTTVRKLRKAFGPAAVSLVESHETGIAALHKRIDDTEARAKLEAAAVEETAKATLRRVTQLEDDLKTLREYITQRTKTKDNRPLRDFVDSLDGDLVNLHQELAPLYCSGVRGVLARLWLVLLGI